MRAGLRPRPERASGLHASGRRARRNISRRMKTMRRHALAIATLGALLSLALEPAPARAADEEAYQIQVVTRTGGRFTGLVPASSRLISTLDGREKVNGADLPPELSFRLKGVNGLEGSIGLKARE